MKEIKLSGRERSVVRAIDSSTGTSGEEIMASTHLAADDLADVLNGLMDAGFVESVPYMQNVSVDAVGTTMFEVNPSYAQSLHDAMYGRKEE